MLVNKNDYLSAIVLDAEDRNILNKIEIFIKTTFGGFRDIKDILAEQEKEREFSKIKKGVIQATVDAVGTSTLKIESTKTASTQRVELLNVNFPRPKREVSESLKINELRSAWKKIESFTGNDKVNAICQFLNEYQEEKEKLGISMKKNLDQLIPMADVLKKLESTSILIMSSSIESLKKKSNKKFTNEELEIKKLHQTLSLHMEHEKTIINFGIKSMHRENSFGNCFDKISGSIQELVHCQL